MKKLFLAFTLVASMVTPTFASDTIKKLQEISVTVQTNSGSGSGVIKTRKIGDENYSFIWTANHVIKSLRHTREIIDGKSGTKREIVEYDDPKITQTINENGRLVATYSLLASVVKTSEEEDLALLMVRKTNFSTKSVQFYSDKKLPELGETVWNVGSALGIEGSNTVSKGVYSQHGRLLRNNEQQKLKVYDQVSCPGFPGCSGSGVYLDDGRMIGMLTNGSGETFILIIPARRMIDWAKKNNLEWAIDDNTKIPTVDQIEKIVVEDNGVSFDAAKAAAASVRSIPMSHVMDYTIPDRMKINKLFLDNKVFVGEKTVGKNYLFLRSVQ